MADFITASVTDKFDIHIIKTDKFKTNVISLYIHVPILKETVTKTALIPSVLKRGTQTHQTFADIYKYTEDLYGAKLDCGIRRKGDGAVIFITVEFAQAKFIGEDITKKIISLIKDIAFDPYLDNGAFCPDYTVQEKDNLARFIEGMINDKRDYAHHKCLETMFPNDPYGIYEYGFVSDLPQINSANLYEHYKHLINTCKIDIFFSGGSTNQVEDMIKETFSDVIAPRGGKCIQTSPAPHSLQNDTKNVAEHMPINQGKLCMGLTCGVDAASDEYYALMLANSIFGGGPFSKLFNNVREKLSLAYYVYSRLDRLKGIMTIGSGIESDKYSAAYDEIMFQLDEMKNGNISDSEIDSAKKYIANGLLSMKDSLLVMEDYYLSQIILGQSLSIDQFLQNLIKVEKDAVIAAANKIRLNTVYLLSNNESEEH